MFLCFCRPVRNPGCLSKCARIFSSGSQNRRKLEFSRSIQTASLLTLTLPACQSNFTQATSSVSEGTQLTSVRFYECYKITGACCPRNVLLGCGPVRFFWKKFLLSSCANFLSRSCPGKFLNLAPFEISFTHAPALPACQSYSTQATSRCWESVRSWRAWIWGLLENHRWVLLRMFFPEVAAQRHQKFLLLSREFSRVLAELALPEISSLPSSLTHTCPACLSIYSTQATSKCSEIASS